MDVEDIFGDLPERSRRGRQKGLTFSQWFANLEEGHQQALVARAKQYGNPVPLTVSRSVTDEDGNVVTRVSDSGNEYPEREVIGGLLPDVETLAERIGGRTPTQSSVREEAAEVLSEYGIEFISRNTDSDEDETTE